VSPTENEKLMKLVSDVMAYYRQPVSEFLLTVWSNACQPFTLEQVQKALTAHVTDAAHGHYPPKIADMVRSLAGTQAESAALAWGKTLEAMARVGAYTDVCFDDPAIHAAIEDCGGWVKVCRTETAELSYLQHRFCQSHKAYTGRGTFEYQRQLKGDRSSDEVYLEKGLPVPEPALIGDADRAKLVYQGGNISGKTAITYAPLDSLMRLAADRQGATA